MPLCEVFYSKLVFFFRVAYLFALALSVSARRAAPRLAGLASHNDDTVVQHSGGVHGREHSHPKVPRRRQEVCLRRHRGHVAAAQPLARGLQLQPPLSACRSRGESALRGPVELGFVPKLPRENAVRCVFCARPGEVNADRRAACAALRYVAALDPCAPAGATTTTTGLLAVYTATFESAYNLDKYMYETFIPTSPKSISRVFSCTSCPTQQGQFASLTVARGEGHV